MTVRPEAFILSADAVAVWSLTRTPILGGNVPADETLESELDHALRREGFDPAGAILRHGTSTRQDGPALLATHVVVYPVPTPDAFALDLTADAAPIGRTLLEHYGPPAPHPADRFPEEIRAADVLQHALRHLAFLVDTDDAAAAALGQEWRRHLAPLRPALAVLYTQ